MNSAKASLAVLLRAPWNFEEDYNGQPGSVPVIFTSPYTPQPLAAGVADTFTALDPEAALATPPAGISPLLAKFVPCALGSTQLFIFPQVPLQLLDGEYALWAYVWRVIFRLRNVSDYNRRKKNRLPYSVGTGKLGVYDWRGGGVIDRPALAVAGERYIRPAIAESVIYSRLQPQYGEAAPYFGTLEPDAVAIQTADEKFTTTPLYPGAHGAQPGQALYVDYEQGERDPSISLDPEIIKANTSSHHLAKFLKCAGNEYVVECFKYNVQTQSGLIGSPRDWEFVFDANGNVVSGEDYGFSLLLGVGVRGLAGGTRSVPVDTGVRVISGTFPY
jgi:hypothetical protein